MNTVARVLNRAAGDDYERRDWALRFAAAACQNGGFGNDPGGIARFAVKLVDALAAELEKKSGV